MFPVKLCGLWTLIASTDPQYIGSDLTVDYNTIKVSPTKLYGGVVQVKKNICGSVFLLPDEKSAKIIWLNRRTFDVEVGLLPRVRIPYDEKCTRVKVTFELDETENWMTVRSLSDRYIFRRNLVYKEKNGETISKIFVTQLLIDAIIRHLYPH
jgi:hypothetical protein